MQILGGELEPEGDIFPLSPPPDPITSWKQASHSPAVSTWSSCASSVRCRYVMAVCLTVRQPSQHIRAIPEQVNGQPTLNQHYSFAMIQKAMRHYILHVMEFAGWKHTDQDSVTAHNSVAMCVCVCGGGVVCV